MIVVVDRVPAASRMDPALAPRSSRWPRRLRNGAVALAVAFAVYALAGFLIAPELAKPRLEALVTEQLGRQATLGRLEFNPFTLRARLLEFALADRDPKRPFFRFASLDVDVSVASLRYLAPVLDAVRLVRPQIDITRNADGTSSIDDLVARAVAGPAGPPTPFSLNNIEVDDGSLALDDRPQGRKIVVSALGIGIPFLSSLSHDATIRVEPRLDGAIDGARFRLTGDSTSPFADTRDATLELNLDALPLARYVGYAPLPGGLKLTDGALTTRLRLAFVTEKGVARTVALSGTARIDQLAIMRGEGTQVFGARSVDVALGKLDALARSIVIDHAVVDAPALDLRRASDGTLELERLLSTRAEPAQVAKKTETTRRAGAPKAPDPTASANAWRYVVADFRVRGGTALVADGAVSPAFGVTLSNITAEAKGIASDGAAGTFDVAFDTDGGARFEARGDADVARASVRGHAALKAFRLANLSPYYASALNVEVRSGALDLAADFSVTNAGATPQVLVSAGAATVTDFETALEGEREPLWRIARAEAAGVALDLAQRSLAVDAVDVQKGTVRVARDPDGKLKFERLVRRTPASAADAPREPRAERDAGWSMLIRKLTAAGLAADIDDRAIEPPVRLHVADARVAIANLGNLRDAKSSLELAGRIGAAGRMHVVGTFVADPLAADVRVDAVRIDLVPLRPYFEARTNVVVTSGTFGAKGRLTYAAARDGTPRVGCAGDLTIDGFGSLDRPTSQELARWETLTLTGVDAGIEPLRIAIGAVALNKFYARVTLNADATLNLQQLLAPPAAQPEPRPPAPQTRAGVTTKELATPAAANELPVSIGRIELSQGELQYADFFVKPNYTAHLTAVSGSVSAMSAARAGTVDVTGRIEGTAPVEVRGTVNPFAQNLELDLSAKATDIDLPPLTPYSVKYAGYGVQKGKLSFEVHYKVDDRKLAATNRLKLDQLTFGERVDSPTATKLPVLLAVSLLKDRNGVINLDLPIAGTLDDPQFSVWGVLVQIFVNLITKAVTAPFALLGAIAGGGGEQLAYVEFAPGHADLEAAAQAKLRTLAKALADRPALKIDASGRAVPELDREGLKRAMLEGALRAQKQKTLAAQGESAPQLGALTIDAAEYPKLLAAVYRDADLPTKPRNVLGIAKSIPPAEMEALLLASYHVDDQALAALANRRAIAVKEWLATDGAVATERIFVVAPKVTGDGVDDKGAPTRVDFAIR
jgi:uncharacterized protein involved in outer membrane biogenesis